MTILVLILVAVLILFVLAISRRYHSEDHSRYDSPAAPLIMDAVDVSQQHQDVVSTLREYNRNATRDVKRSREQMEALFGRDVEAKITPVDVNGVPGEWVLASGADPDLRLLYIHGGAFRVGSPKSHRYIASELSRLAGVSVLAIDYRMQPEYKIINCHEDCRTAYQWILDNGPSGETAAKQIFVAGDSAGGNLTLAVIAWARNQGLRAASAVAALAPATDATFRSPSWVSNIKSDPFLGPGLGRLVTLPKFLMALATFFTTGLAENNPQISPLLGDLSDLPPTLIQVSQQEMLFDDGHRYANKAISQGSEVEIQVWPTMVHVFQAFAPELPEARVALDNIGEFIRSRIV